MGTLEVGDRLTSKKRTLLDRRKRVFTSVSLKCTEVLSGRSLEAAFAAGTRVASKGWPVLLVVS